MRGNWALSPCLELGETCEAGFECCDGYCIDEGDGPVCSDEVPECALIGDACETSGDCCDEDAECIGGFCDALFE